jgi:hypothetical protein
MRDDDLHEFIAFTIRSINDGWIVVLPDEVQIGPYQNGDVAL